MTNGNDGIKAKKYSNSGGGYESAGNISNVQADGTTDNKEVTDAKDAKKEAYEMSQAKGSGNVKSIRENIADYLPDSAIRRRMLLKAEKKREKLNEKFGEKEYSAPNNAINAKDIDKFERIGKGQSEDDFYRYDQFGNPIKK